MTVPENVGKRHFSGCNDPEEHRETVSASLFVLDALFVWEKVDRPPAKCLQARLPGPRVIEVVTA
jgi:hypothetical protein